MSMAVLLREGEERPSYVTKEIHEKFGWGRCVDVDGDRQHSNLMITWSVGDPHHRRPAFRSFAISSRLNRRIQLSTDGLAVYPEAVEPTFHGETKSITSRS